MTCFVFVCCAMLFCASCVTYLWGCWKRVAIIKRFTRTCVRFIISRSLKARKKILIAELLPSFEIFMSLIHLVPQNQKRRHIAIKLLLQQQDFPLKQFKEFINCMRVLLSTILPFEFEIFRAYQFIRTIYVYNILYYIYLEIQRHFRINVKIKLQCQRVHFLGAHNTTQYNTMIQLTISINGRDTSIYSTLAAATNTLDRFSNTRQQWWL